MNNEIFLYDISSEQPAPVSSLSMQLLSCEVQSIDQKAIVVFIGGGEPPHV